MEYNSVISEGIQIYDKNFEDKSEIYGSIGASVTSLYSIFRHVTNDTVCNKLANDFKKFVENDFLKFGSRENIIPKIMGFLVGRKLPGKVGEIIHQFLVTDQTQPQGNW